MRRRVINKLHVVIMLDSVKVLQFKREHEYEVTDKKD